MLSKGKPNIQVCPEQWMYNLSYKIGLLRMATHKNCLYNILHFNNVATGTRCRHRPDKLGSP